MATPNLNLETIELTDNMRSSLLEKMNNNFAKIDSAYETLKSSLLEKTRKTTLSEAIDYIDQLVNANDATATADKIFNGYTAYKGTEKITGTALATATTAAASQILNGLKMYNNSGTLVTGTMINNGGVSVTATGSTSNNDYRLKIPTTGYYNTTSYLTRQKSLVLSDLGVETMPTINVTLTGSYASRISGYGAGIDNSGNLVIWAMSNNTAVEHVSFANTSIGAGTIGAGWGITNVSTTSGYAENPRACTITGLGRYSTINLTLNAAENNTSNDYVGIQVTLTAS